MVTSRDETASKGYVDPASMVYSSGYTSYNDLGVDAKALELIYLINDDPIKGVRALFGVWPTKQQQEFILASWEANSMVAVSSCTGVGKTAVLVWLTYMFLLCKYDCRILVTSPSFSQLNRVYHSEALKWKSAMPDVWSDMFTVTRERIVLNIKKGIQVANIVTAKVENKESLQGGHSENYVILGDEFSAIVNDVFGVLLATLSYGICRFIITSNPTKNSGPFFDIFHKLQRSGTSNWKTFKFNAFDCPHTREGFIENIKQHWGEDSDEYRVKVLGEFPKQSVSQFISSEAVERALVTNIPERDVMQYPRICGVDVARGGSAKTVFITRQGPKVLDITSYQGMDGPEVANKLLDCYRIWGHQEIYIDATGVGVSPYDTAKRIPGMGSKVIPLNVSLPSSRSEEYANVRAHLWGELKNWLTLEADLPYNDNLRDQIIAQTYTYSTRNQAYQMTSKKDMHSEGIESPDFADALTYTFGDKLHETRRKRFKKRNVIKRKKNFIGTRR